MAKSKYRAVRTTVNGLEFASQKEARRYQDLLILERAGRINGLELQPRFPCRVNDQLVCTYVADFRYIEDGLSVVEDVKGMKTDVYRIKAKLVKALYGFTIKEI
jgi:hypothetical protein